MVRNEGGIPHFLSVTEDPGRSLQCGMEKVFLVSKKTIKAEGISLYTHWHLKESSLSAVIQHLSNLSNRLSKPTSSTFICVTIGYLFCSCHNSYRAYMRLRMHVCARMRVRVCVCMHACACVHAHTLDIYIDVLLIHSFSHLPLIVKCLELSA